MKTLNYANPGAPMQGYATVPATSDAKEYLRLLIRHKFGLLLTLLVGLLAAWLYLISTDKIYETQALVEVNPEKNYLREDGSSNQIDWNAPVPIKEETNLLMSRKVLTPVVEAFNLRTSAEPRRIPVLGDLTQRIPALGDLIGNLSFTRQFAWGDVNIELAELQVPRQWQDVALTLTALGENAYSLSDESKVLIEQAEVGSTVQVDMPNSDPLVLNVAALDAPAGVEFSISQASLQAAITNLTSQFSTDASDTKSRMITTTLRGKDPTLIADLTNAILTEYAGVKMGTQNRSSDAELLAFEQQLPNVEAELREAELALSEFRVREQSFDSDTQMKFKLGQVDKLENELLELEVERDDLLKRYTVNHPTPIRLQKSIDVINDKLRQVRSTIRNAPDTDREKAILEDDLETKRSLFNEINEKVKKLRLAEAGNVDVVEIIDPALKGGPPAS